MIRVAVLALGAGLFLPTPSFALFDRGTGNELLAICKNDIRTHEAFCLAYITGVLHAAPACIPKGSTKSQIRDIAIKYLNDNPNRRNLPAALLVVAALNESFPCASPAWQAYLAIIFQGLKDPSHTDERKLQLRPDP